MKRGESKNSTYKKDFYLTILNELRGSTNLTKIRKKLNISKQNLNYYLRRLKKEGLIENSSYGYWKLTNQSKNSTKYGKLLSKDTIRGHAYIVTIKLPENIENWNKRIEILKQKNINFKLVGAKQNTPRIKALGRKVWLCNNHLRIFDKSEESYYGRNAIESRKLAFLQFKRILSVLENKLGIKLNPINIEFKKEHYALIKNDLAIEHNRKGEILRIEDENGEWLIIDDSLGKGGELETIGKKALTNNLPLQKWWNDHKERKFKVTPTFILDSLNQVTQNQLMFAKNIDKHMKVLEGIEEAITYLKEEIRKNNR